MLIIRSVCVVRNYVECYYQTKLVVANVGCDGIVSQRRELVADVQVGGIDLTSTSCTSIYHPVDKK